VTTHGVRKSVVVSTLAALLVTPVVADAQNRRAVPRQSAVVVRSGPAVRGAVGVGYARPYYRPSYYRPYYRAAYPYYSPFVYPFGFSFSFGYPYYGAAYYGAGPYYGGAYYGAGPYYGGYPYGPYAYPYYGGYNISSLRLQVTPREAEVFIDGYYAGNVDNFDGTFQRLNLQPGQHNLELFMPGYRSFAQKIYVQPGNTFRVQQAMQPLAAGEPEPTRPVAPTPPPSASGAPRGSQRIDPRGPQRPPPPQAGAREEAPNANSGSGTIALRVQPGDAIVFIDGERWDASQGQDRLEVQLGAGVHTVEIRKDGFRSYITDITVRRGETTPLNVSLTRQ
jgi:PEGA domain